MATKLRGTRRRAILVALILAVVAGGSMWFLLWRGRQGVPLEPHVKLPAAIDSPRLVIIKSTHELIVYDGQRRLKTYRAGMGGGKGDKVREGDRRTPEGDFYVCTKNPNSRFVLSLGLSYPNAVHAERGLRDGLIDRQKYDQIMQALAERRQPDWYTPLGGEIMIHGCGGGRDWTLGCVALDDDDIRELYPLIPVGTPVTILP